MGIICEKKELILSFKDEKPMVYRIVPVRQQRISFDKLLDETSKSCGVGRAQVKASIEALLDRMSMFMDLGMPVNLGDFGSFKPTINVKTQKNIEDVSAENVTRKKIQFYPGKRFKDMLSDLSVTTLDDTTSKGASPEGGEEENPDD